MEHTSGLEYGLIETSECFYPRFLLFVARKKPVLTKLPTDKTQWTMAQRQNQLGSNVVIQVQIFLQGGYTGPMRSQTKLYSRS